MDDQDCGGSDHLGARGLWWTPGITLCYTYFMKIQVWHIPQVPGKPFLVEVPTLDEAIRLCDTLDKYDIFQYENEIKPDYCNATGIELINDAGEVAEVDPDNEDNMEEAWAIVLADLTKPLTS